MEFQTLEEMLDAAFNGIGGTFVALAEDHAEALEIYRKIPSGLVYRYVGETRLLLHSGAGVEVRRKTDALDWCASITALHGFWASNPSGPIYGELRGLFERLNPSEGVMKLDILKKRAPYVERRGDVWAQADGGEFILLEDPVDGRFVAALRKKFRHREDVLTFQVTPRNRDTLFKGATFQGNFLKSGAKEWMTAALNRPVAVTRSLQVLRIQLLALGFNVLFCDGDGIAPVYDVDAGYELTSEGWVVVPPQRMRCLPRDVPVEDPDLLPVTAVRALARHPLAQQHGSPSKFGIIVNYSQKEQRLAMFVQHDSVGVS